MTLTELFKKDGPIWGIWNSCWTGVPLWLASISVVAFWYFRIPSPGYAIGALAVVAGIISVREIQVLGKILWVVIIIFMLLIEFRAIKKDRCEAQDTADKHLQEERDSFKRVLSQQGDNFRGILADDQRHFEGTLRVLLRGEATSRTGFATLLARSNNLFEHEEELAASESGILLPGHGAVPKNNCGAIPEGGALVMLGDVKQGIAATIQSFPAKVLEKPELSLSLSRTARGNLGITMDLRSGDGKILVRMDGERYVINRSNILEVQKDSGNHDLRVFDLYGKKVLEVNYLNPSVINVIGDGIGLPTSFEMICTGSLRPGQVGYEMSPTHRPK